MFSSYWCHWNLSGLFILLFVQACMVATATTISQLLYVLCAMSICWKCYKGVVVFIFPVTDWNPLLALLMSYVFRLPRERRDFAGASQWRNLNENEGLCFPWAAAEDLSIGGLEVRWLLKILLSWNVNRSLARFTANLSYRVARTLSVLLKAKIVNSSPNSQWYVVNGCSLLPPIFIVQDLLLKKHTVFRKCMSWRDIFPLLLFPNPRLIVKAYLFSKAIF